MNQPRPEVWLRGPVQDVPPQLQPVAHALLQAVEEVELIAGEIHDHLLWTRPAGVASAGFHLQHLSGVLDRLFTYARGEQLSEAQRGALAAEGHPEGGPGEQLESHASSATGTTPRAVELAAAFRRQVDRAIDQLRATVPATLSEPREVGRARLPSTVLGLLVHAAEHTQRHVGQLLVTVRMQARAPAWGDGGAVVPSGPESGGSDPRFPIGPFRYPDPASAGDRNRWIAEIAGLPGQLRQAVGGLTAEQWNTPYRPGGWTIRQLVHHLPDSHLNGYVRFKLALTETDPVIKPYDEAAWAELPDSRLVDPEISLALLADLHTRWASLLSALTDRDFHRRLFHPGLDRHVELGEYLAMYAWHGRHHLAHITGAARRLGWS